MSSEIIQADDDYDGNRPGKRPHMRWKHIGEELDKSFGVSI